MKKTMNYAALIALTICFFLGCNRRIDSGLKEATTKNLTVSSLDNLVVDSIYLIYNKLIELETSDSSLIAGINSIAMDDNYLFIMDKHQQAILIFDQEGNYVNKIRAIGLGPYEYVQIVSFTIDTQKKEILISCSIPEKLMHFSYEGVFIKEEKNRNKGFYLKVAIQNDWLYFENLDYTSDKNAQYQISLKNCQTNEFKQALPIIRGISNYVYNNGDAMTESENAVHYVRRYDNSIYRLDAGELYKEYTIDFKEMAAFNLMYETGEYVFQTCYSNDRIFSMTNVVDSEETMMFYTDKGVFFYDKRRDKLKGFREIKNSKWEDHTMKYYLPVKKTNSIAFVIERATPISSLNNSNATAYIEKNPMILVYKLK